VRSLRLFRGLRCGAPSVTIAVWPLATFLRFVAAQGASPSTLQPYLAWLPPPPFHDGTF